MPPRIHLEDAHWAIGGNSGGLAVRKDQEVTSEFLETLAEERFQSSRAPTKDFHRFASIPTVIVEKWRNEGFDVFREPAKAIIKRLRRENRDEFLTSNKVL